MASAAEIVQRFLRLGFNSYTRDEMDSRFVPQGILPVSRIGTINADPLPCSLSGTDLVVSTDIPVLLGGRAFKLAAGRYSFASVIAGNAQTRPLYCYVVLTGGIATFSFSFTALAEATGRVNIGSITMTNLTASNLQLEKVSRLDTYRPSTTPKGSAIPVSTGTPDSVGSIGW